MSLLSSTVSSSIAGYAAAAALAVGLAGGWQASHYIRVVPMRLVAAEVIAAAAETGRQAEAHNRQVEQETSHALDTLVTTSQARQRAAESDLRAVAERLRIARATATADGRLPEVQPAGGIDAAGPSGGLEGDRDGIGGIRRAAARVAAAASAATDALTTGPELDGRLERATAAALTCGQLTDSTLQVHRSIPPRPP